MTPMRATRRGRVLRCGRALVGATLVLVGGCVLPELTIDRELEDDGAEDGGTSGTSGGDGGSNTGGTAGGTAGDSVGGSSGEGNSGSGGDSGGGSDSGGNGGSPTGGSGGASGGSAGKGGTSGGSGATTGCSACSTDEDCCSMQCVNLANDEAHCGGCGDACPAGQVCSAGNCACPSGLTYCAPSCVDTDISVSHCGQCDSPCLVDQSCSLGGCTGPCGSAFAVTSGGWVTAPGASGSCWRGYAYIAQNETMLTPSSFMNCGNPCMLCVQGDVLPTQEFTGFVNIGVNLAQPSTGAAATVVPQGSSLQVTFTNTTNAPLRIQLEGPNSATNADDRWCANVSGASPLTIPYSQFRTNCWDMATSVAYTKQPLRSISLTVPGSNLASVPVNVCLLGFADQ